MSVNDGRITLAKNRIKSQLQNKGVEVLDSTPFSDYYRLIANNLKNKSWVYPDEWVQLTPQNEMPNNTIEIVLAVKDNEDNALEFYFDNYSSGHSVTAPQYTLKIEGIHYSSNPPDVARFLGYGYLKSGVTYRSQDLTPLLMDENEVRLSDFDYSYAFEQDPLYPFRTYKITVTFNDSEVYMEFTKGYENILAMRVRKDDGEFGMEFASTTNSLLTYYDLSRVTTGYFWQGYPNLIKLEVKEPFAYADNLFEDCTNLREIAGLDFESIYDLSSATTSYHKFKNCECFTPPALNYVGIGSYINVALTGDVYLPAVASIPKDFISCSTPRRLDGRDIGNYALHLNEANTTFLRNAFSKIQGRIKGIPNKALTTQSALTGLTAKSISNAFFYNPERLIDWDTMTTTNPITVIIDENAKTEEIDISKIKVSYVKIAKPLKHFKCKWSVSALQTITPNSLTTVIVLSGNLSDDFLKEFLKPFQEDPTLDGVGSVTNRAIDISGITSTLSSTVETYLQSMVADFNWTVIS